jgi:hypothetical protein
VIASDIFDYGYGTAPHDFRYDEPLTRPDWIITNPPFSIACEFTLRALDLATEGVAMLARTQWIEGTGCGLVALKRTVLRRPRAVQVTAGSHAFGRAKTSLLASPSSR